MLKADLFPDSVLSNGVKARVDGKGDGWANAHRLLGPDFLMQDCDGLFGQLTFCTNSADRLFMEYVPDGYQNRHTFNRNFAMIALFDRKRTLELALAESNLMSMQTYAWQCRIFSLHQPVPARFFIVHEPDPGPWKITEINTLTGQHSDSVVIHTNEMRKVWDQLGLIENRRELKRWISRPTVG